MINLTKIAKLILEISDYDSKDEKRIKDLFAKSKGDDAKLLQLAKSMAKKITDPEKAVRRGNAAKTIIDEPKLTNIFHDRAKELGWTDVDNPKQKLKPGKGYIFLPTYGAIALWDHEIMGQISDGYWENTKPHNHWEFWGNLKTKKGKPEVQSTGWASKKNYAIANSSLISIVGDRMINKGRLATALKKDITNDQNMWTEDAPDTYEEWEEMMLDKSKRTGSFMSKYFNAVKPKDAKKYYDTKYDKSDMIKDLKWIKKAMETA